jgi:orotate phosphoribosyltransferase
MKNSAMQLLSDEQLILKDILARKSLSFGEVTLSSGESSKVYVDGKLTTCFAEAMPLVGRAFLGKLAGEGWAPQAVGGLTLGADPIAIAVARESLTTASVINAFIVRKVVKEHGKQRWIEGIENPDGCRVVIIDDVCTKGGSTAQAIETAQKNGMKVLGAICLVDRQEGAAQLLERKFNLRLASIFTLNDLIAHKELIDREPIGMVR